MCEYVMRLVGIMLLTVIGSAGPCLARQLFTRGVDAVGNSLQEDMVWTPDAEPGRQVYTVFRKTFSLALVPHRANLH